MSLYPCQTVALNFIMAYPLQIFVVGPFCRFLFRVLFGAFGGTQKAIP